MTHEEIYEQFNEVDDEYRMLCIDSAAVGCYLFQHGQQAAGMKLLHTAITSAGLDTALVQTLLSKGEKAFDGLAMHAEIRELIKNFSG